MDSEQGQCWRVGMLFCYILGGLSIAFFSFAGVMAWVSGQSSALLIFFPFIALSLALILMSSTTELTETHLLTFTPLGTFEMAWTEITAVSVTSDTLIFYAAGKQIYVPYPGFWSGRDKHQAKEFLLDKLVLYQPPVVSGPRLLIFSRNCKQKRRT